MVSLQRSKIIQHIRWRSNSWIIITDRSVQRIYRLPSNFSSTLGPPLSWHTYIRLSAEFQTNEYLKFHHYWIPYFPNLPPEVRHLSCRSPKRNQFDSNHDVPILHNIHLMSNYLGLSVYHINHQITLIYLIYLHCVKVFYPSWKTIWQCLARNSWIAVPMIRILFPQSNQELYAPNMAAS